MKLYGFANFVDHHLVLYDCASISLVVVEAFIIEGILLYDNE